MESRLEKIKTVVEIIFKLVSIAALLVSGIWVLYHFVLTDEMGSNIELSLSTNQIKLNDKSTLLVTHAHPANRGKAPVEIGGKVGGSFRITVKQIKEKDMKDGEWLNQESLPVVKDTDILRHHKGGYIIEPNGSYDDVESIALSPGIYHIEANLEWSEDYFNVYSIVKIE